MKNTLSIFSLLILFVNCNKEVVKQTSAASSDVSNTETRDRYTSSMPVDYTEFNTCTQEYVHITGFWNYVVTWTTVGNRTNYTYHFKYDGVTGVGLTSGTKYQGTGHVTEHDVSVWNGEGYDLERSKINNKIIFTSKGGDNNFSSYAFYDFKVGDNGALMVDESRFKFNYCQ